MQRRSAERDPDVELRSLAEALAPHYEADGWWPARTRFEMMAGAILTQRTRWETAARALARLRRAGWLGVESLAGASRSRLTATIRPCGDPRTKARRLQALAGFVSAAGGLRSLERLETGVLRRRLLSVHGVGPETADAILLYAFRRPAFIADAYALRWLTRTGWLARARLPARYAAVHRRVTSLLEHDVPRLAALHARIVEHGKRLCGARPRCTDCFLAVRCSTGRRVTGSRGPDR